MDSNFARKADPRQAQPKDLKPQLVLMMERLLEKQGNHSSITGCRRRVL